MPITFGGGAGGETYYGIYYVTEFKYSGKGDVFTAPTNGWYKVQLWGAKGGNDQCRGGNGGYVEGEIKLLRNQMIYVYVGAPGLSGTQGTGAGYNGGGNSGSDVGGWSGSGGGATDIRLIGGAWNNYNSLRSRILVAGGGGGGGCWSNGGVGGGLVGGSSAYYSGGNQYRAGNLGGFGYGGTSQVDGGGGGGGWYGGGASAGGTPGGQGNDEGGGGGSSYIGGYGGAIVRNAYTRSGAEWMPNYYGGSMVGNAGPCHTKFSVVEQW